jgi:carbonic anhydrase
MTVTDELLANSGTYAAAFTKGDLPLPPTKRVDIRQSIARIQASPFVPCKDRVRGFVYEVETGKLREVS